VKSGWNDGISCSAGKSASLICSKLLVYQHFQKIFKHQVVLSVTDESVVSLWMKRFIVNFSIIFFNWWFTNLLVPAGYAFLCSPLAFLCESFASALIAGTVRIYPEGPTPARGFTPLLPSTPARDWRSRIRTTAATPAWTTEASAGNASWSRKAKVSSLFGNDNRADLWNCDDKLPTLW